MTRPSILFISTQLPYPPKSGGTIKSWNYISHLSENFNTALACLLKEDDADHLETFQSKIKLKDLVTVNHHCRRSALNLLKSYLGFPSLNVFRNFSVILKKKVEAIAGEYDLLLIDHYEMFQYVPKSFQGKVVLHTHNAEFALWERMAELSGNPLFKILLGQEGLRVRKYERKIIKKADLTYTTPSDLESYTRAGITEGNLSITYHLGDDSLLDLPDIQFEDTEMAILFMGTLSWEPNIDGLHWFIEKIFPKMLEQEEQLRLYVLGKDPDDRLRDAAANYPEIEFCGFIEDIDSYMKKCRLFIAPLRFGSGMKVKVLEGMYRGTPMVSTSVGAEGLEVKHGEELLIADQAGPFAEAGLQLMKDRKLWERLRDQSRKKAGKTYRWKSLFKRMDKALNALF